MDKWDIRFLRLAREVANWSKDPSRQIGAIIVDDDHRILGTGYNGFPSGIKDLPERLDDREIKYKYVVHAELNALLNCLKSGISVRNSTIYVAGLPPCTECAKAIIQSGVKRVVSLIPDKMPENWAESCRHTDSMFEEVGLQSEQYYNEVLNELS